jgi:hypothetical protein
MLLQGESGIGERAAAGEELGEVAALEILRDGVPDRNEERTVVSLQQERDVRREPLNFSGSGRALDPRSAPEGRFQNVV